MWRLALCLSLSVSLWRNQQSSVVDNHGNHYRRNRGASTVSPDERGSNSSFRKITLSRCGETVGEEEGWWGAVEDGRRPAGKRIGRGENSRGFFIFSNVNSDVLTLSTTRVRRFTSAGWETRGEETHWRDNRGRNFLAPTPLSSSWRRFTRSKIRNKNLRIYCISYRVKLISE